MRPGNTDISKKHKIVPCGRLGCIVLYTSADCQFCQVAEKILSNVVTANGLPNESINSVKEIMSNEISDNGISSLPTITICDTTITGIPDEETIRDALTKVSLKECFLEDIT